ncbi:hypothetical protein EV175_000439 [Coemansia sp. RSA 1933]|nr:hypothetical protein EV175_000439 [Coemansia sp. RSA 1933]
MARFSTYEVLKKKLTLDDGSLPFYRMAFAGVAAGAIGGICGTPADIVLVRLQNDGARPVEKRRNYRNAFDGLIRIAREEGSSTLLKGVVPNTSRAIVMTGAQLCSYDTFKQLLLSTPYLNDGLPLHFAASFMAGFVATTTTSPFDVVNTRIMNSGPASRYKNLLQAMAIIVKEEGPLALYKGWTPAFVRTAPQTILTFIFLEQFRNLYWDQHAVRNKTSTTRKRALQTTRRIVHEAGILGLYSGLSAALLRQGTYTMARFAVYDLAKDVMQQANGGGRLSGMQVGMATLLSGVAGGIVGNPAEILNVRMQNDQALPVHLRRNYRNAAHGLVAMVKEEGVRSLTIGLGPSLVRATLATASQFVSYDILKEQLLVAGYPDTVSVHFAASFMAGLVATTVCSPADVIKSRTMAALRHQSHVVAKDGSRVNPTAPGMWRTFASIYQTEGLRAFFKGWLPSYARLCPQLVITFIIYEKLRKLYFSRYNAAQLKEH